MVLVFLNADKFSWANRETSLIQMTLCRLNQPRGIDPEESTHEVFA
jgi:hypothetical protein